MDNKYLFISNSFCLLVLYFSPLVGGNAPFGFCADTECTKPVGKGISVLRYLSPDDNRISIDVNEEVLIYVKDYGPKKDLLGVVVKGNRGYISKNFIRETQVLMKKLVPAMVEFKSSTMFSKSYSGSSHLHASSPPLKSGMYTDEVMPESLLQMETIQQKFNSMPPNSFQQNQGSHSQNSESSQFLSNMNPSSSMEFDSRFQHLSSQPNNIPMHSNQFPSGKFASPYMTDSESVNIFPSPTPVPNMNHPSQSQTFSDRSLSESQLLHNSLNTIPNFEQRRGSLDLSQDHLVHNSEFSDQPIQNNYLRPSNPQHQHFHSSKVLERHSSFQSLDIDEELSRTMAMLNDRGFVDNKFFDDSNFEQAFPESHIHSSSQNLRQEFDNTNAFGNSRSNQDFPEIYPSSQNVELDFDNTESYSRSASNWDFQDSDMYTSNQNMERAFDNAETFGNLGSDQGFHGSNTDLSSQNMARSFDNTEMYDSSISGKDILRSDVHASLQNLDNKDFDLNEAGMDTILMQSQQQPMHNSDSLYFSSINPSQPLEEPRSYTPEISQSDDNQPTENIIDQEKNYISDLMKEENVEEDEGTDILAESEEDSENLLSPETKNANVLMEEHENTKMLPNLQSSMTTNEHEQQASEIHENSIRDSNSFLESSIAEASTILDFTKTIISEVTDSLLNTISNSQFDEKSNVHEEKSGAISESFSGSVPERNSYGAFPEHNIVHNDEPTTPKVIDLFVESEKSFDLDKISDSLDIKKNNESLETYQIRNLKGEFESNEEQQSEFDGSNEENSSPSHSEVDVSTENWLDSFRAFVDAIMAWIPEPLYSTLMDLQNKDLSPRVPVFTALCGFICIFLIVPIVCIKEWSKESKLSAQLASVEKEAYTLSATNAVLEEKLETVQSELTALQAEFAEEKSASKRLKIDFENQEEELENAKAEIESCLQVIDSLKEKENEYLTTIQEQEKEIERYIEHKEALDKIMKDQENSISVLTDQLHETEDKVKELEKEKLNFLQLKDDYEEKLSQFDKNCKQLLAEAEVWNSRVQELTTTLDEERKMKEEFIDTLKVKDEEIESLKELVEAFKLFEEIEDPEEQAKAKEEKLQSLMNSSMLVNQLKQEEEKSKLLDEQLTKEKNRIIDMEVELLEAKSEIDKLKISYNQALQDKAEAQTKLEVLTNYFKDKEIQLQKQLGAQEAVRQKKEEDANSAERRICLIEQENASYKSQLASMKQEMEETERNLKSQIATHDKKAHDNWIAARAAERKLEDMKQEVAQLRQRLTLMEREQGNWANASRDEVIRPVPKRMPGVNDELGNEDQTSERGIFPQPPPLHDRLPPHMMLPPDRPLPPLPPPPMPPMFLPPPMLERHFRPQPWHIPPDHRTTPPEFMTRRESTPPRAVRRDTSVTDADAGPHASSPLTTDTRDSRNSTPPHLLPDFHDVPPQPGRPFFPPPPPLGHHRMSMHPPFRRDVGPEPKRLDHPNEFNSRNSQQTPSQEQWQHSRV